VIFGYEPFAFASILPLETARWIWEEGTITGRILLPDGRRLPGAPVGDASAATMLTLTDHIRDCYKLEGIPPGSAASSRLLASQGFSEEVEL
jgi:hypothetical protein